MTPKKDWRFIWLGYAVIALSIDGLYQFGGVLFGFIGGFCLCKFNAAIRKRAQDEEWRE